MERQCRWAVIAAAMSTRCITRPPKIFPKTLASCGSTTSVISVREALTSFPANFSEFLTLLVLGTSLLHTDRAAEVNFVRLERPAIIRVCEALTQRTHDATREENATRITRRIRCGPSPGRFRALRVGHGMRQSGRFGGGRSQFRKTAIRESQLRCGLFPVRPAFGATFANSGRQTYSDQRYRSGSPGRRSACKFGDGSGPRAIGG